MQPNLVTMLDLFNQSYNPQDNLLPEGGIVNYFGPILSLAESDYYYNKFLNEVQWQNDRAIIFGKEIITKRKVAWYGNEPFEYTYSNTTKKALIWTDDLLMLGTKEKWCNSICKFWCRTQICFQT